MEAIDEILVGAQVDCIRFVPRTVSRRLRPWLGSFSIGVVVLDVRLPDIDGIQVLACIREMRPELLGDHAFSVDGSGDRARGPCDSGAADYLAKPLHDEELVLAVGRALDGFEVNTSIGSRLRSRIDQTRRGDGAPLPARTSGGARRARRGAARGHRRHHLRRDPPHRSGLADAGGCSISEWLSVVATRGSELAKETHESARKVGEGRIGSSAYRRGRQCSAWRTPRADRTLRGSRAAGRIREPDGFAIVPLVCLGVPVGVLCLTDV